jgi:hypothetical protein
VYATVAIAMQPHRRHVIIALILALVFLAIASVVARML